MLIENFGSQDVYDDVPKYLLKAICNTPNIGYNRLYNNGKEIESIFMMYERVVSCNRQNKRDERILNKCLLKQLELKKT